MLLQRHSFAFLLNWALFSAAMLFRRSLSTASASKYTSLLKELYKVNLSNPVKMGLQNAEQLNTLLGDPVRGVPIIHVAGTNGKGSVSLKTAECLTRMGLRTGLFVSPHISSFRERIQVDGEMLSEEDVTTLLPPLLQLCDTHGIPATFFELTTLLAFLRFQRAKCDAIVLEVGLGGRLDSTNIVTPALSIITSIQLDHTKILGDTIDKIALEKAGIMKPGVDVLVGPGCPLELLQARALEVGAPFHTLDSVGARRTYRALKTDPHTGRAVPEDIDDLNADIARAGLALLAARGGAKFAPLGKASNAAALEAALATRPPCRYQLFPARIASPSLPVDVVLDIAHNEDAMLALVRKVKAQYAGPVRVVLGMSADKEVDKCVLALFGLFRDEAGMTQADASSRFYCAAARHPRALGATELRGLVDNTARQLGVSVGEAGSDDDNDKDVAEAVRQAVQAVEREQGRGRAQGGLVVVCGTAFIMSAAREALGVVEPRDGDVLADSLRDAQESFGPTSAGGVSKFPELA